MERLSRLLFCAMQFLDITLDQIVIDEGLYYGLRKHTEKEYNFLRDAIVDDGLIFSPLCVWNDGEDWCLCDGRARISIWSRLRENGTPIPSPSIIEVDVAGRNFIKLWMRRNQRGRRNLNMFEQAKMPLSLDEMPRK